MLRPYVNPPRRKQFWTPQRLRRLWELAAKGLARAEIAAKFNISYNRIAQAIEYYKVHVAYATKHTPIRVIDRQSSMPRYSKVAEAMKIDALYAPKVAVPERYKKYITNGPAL